MLETYWDTHHTKWKYIYYDKLIQIQLISALHVLRDLTICNFG